MRLIDADDFLEKIGDLENWCKDDRKRGLEQDMCMIHEQPTAYDVDKVAKQLGESSHWTESTYDEDGYSNDDSEEVVLLYKALKIVKAGGLNE